MLKRIDLFSVLKSCTSKNKQNNDEKVDENKQFSACLKQSLASLGPLILTVVVGMTLGYSAVLLPQLQAHTNVAITINKEEASWVASLAVIPMAAGALIGGVLIQKYGRKMTHIIICFPYCAGWILMYFSFNLQMLLTGRFLTGLCSGIITPATGVYIGETTDPKNRGMLLGGIPLSVSVGLLGSHLLGTFLTWQVTALVVAVFPFIAWLLMTFTPESPAWLAQKGLSDEAQESFYWLRNASEENRQEFEQMIARVKATNNNTNKIDEKNRLKELLEPEFWKPMAILLVFFISSQWAGVNAVTFYSINIMKQTLGESINEYLATFIIDCIRVIASIAQCILIRNIGRRPLALTGGFGTFIPLFILSGFIYSQKVFNIQNPNLVAVPITCLLAYVFFVTAGFVSLPWNLIGELLPMAKRSTGSGIASFVAYMSIFSVVKTMPALFENLGTDGSFLVYGFMALLGTAFVYRCLPETKGKTLHEIEEYFKDSKEDNSKGPLDTRL
ncbi:unnamed protein product [Ceutorhynchus assimilis]|uniref:Major facilitator superfamily (MFS) profile domain-containing protein n=1 Tax=Ceutorhynchus assimilis TaxID=467358 RepID=A0A9N9QH76_9CUCU|nr:unnamed protein product [Ceutorhynchus assimilis]